MKTDYKIHEHGFVRLVDVMGNDDDIAESARVSTKSQKKDNVGLINYLMENEHTSPFEMGVLKFHIKAPIFVARQWMR